MIENSYFRGKRIEPSIPEDELGQIPAALQALFHETSLSPENRDGKPAWLLFDVDGIFIEHKHTPENIAAHFEENKEAVLRIQAAIQKALAQGFHFGLSTGRSVEFVRALVKTLFPSIEPEVIIAESGFSIVRGDAETFPSTITPTDAEALLQIKPDIETRFIENGWRAYKLHHCIGLVWPEGHNPDTALEQVESYLQDRGMAGDFVVIKAPSSIDIFPKGGGKEAALHDAIGTDAAMIYFGDSPGDHGSMKEAAIVVVPQNGQARTKDFTADITRDDHDSKTILALHMKEPLLGGVADSLDIITNTTAGLQ